jgi:beta-1,4-mannosyl-glycoprotein beta-1,4-N-acetylglucosaminyltransferase
MKEYKIIDTFMFNGEFEMLRMRLDYLSDSVDYFVICESDYTQNGNKKTLTFLGNEHIVSEYQHKIHYLVYSHTKQQELII